MRTIVEIAGMPARHAVRAVETALAGVPGISRAEVGLGRAAIEHDGTLDRTALARAIEIAGCRVLTMRDERGLPVLEG